MVNEKISRDSAESSQEQIAAKHKKEDKLNRASEQLGRLFSAEDPSATRLQLATGKNIDEWADRIKIMLDGSIILAEVDSDFGDSENFYKKLTMQEATLMLDESLNRLKKQVRDHEQAIQKIKSQS